MSDIRITSSQPGRAEFHVDGQELHHVRGFTLSGTASNPMRLELDVPVFGTAEVGASDVVVTVPETTRDALVKLGWTPPPDGYDPAATVDEIAALIWRLAAVEFEEHGVEPDPPFDDDDWQTCTIPSERARWREIAAEVLIRCRLTTDGRPADAEVSS